MRVLAVLLLVLLAGCATPAGGGDAGAGGTTAATSAAPADDTLLVVLDRADGTEPERYTLSCGGNPDGDHPDPAGACAQLAALPRPFAALPSDIVCTEQYGGPQTARVTGRWHGEDVDLQLSRTDGCRIAQWDGLGPLLPPVEGVLD
jgi:hypothetical protein